jgi:crotonobetainyl-CoA:carnitine CoA-transferase CaiB-like acyl-CoA transferase
MLQSYRVLDLTDEGALICGQMLADLGADVIVVEPPEGARARWMGPFRGGERNPDRSLTWWALNRNKRSITLDLTTDAGRERLRDLVRSSDFLLESFAPGYLAGLGLGYEQLSALNPRLVMVSITPFGQTGPKAGWAASDLTVYASSGVLVMAGDQDRAPVSIAAPQAYLHAGAEAAVGALIAHHGRERDGIGQHVDVSAQAATMMATQATALAHGWNSPEAQRLAGGLMFNGIPLKMVNPAKDGNVSVLFLFGSAIGPFSRRLMEVMYEEGFVDEATRDKDWINYTTLIATGKEPVSELLRCIEAIGTFTSSHTKDELFRMGMERGLLVVPVSSTADVVDSPQYAARDYWFKVTHPELNETYRYPGASVKLSATPIRQRLRPPLLGEHNAEVQAATPPRTSTASPSAVSGRRAMPLAGVKVLEFTWVIAGPWSIRYLADYGATVVKVESTTRVDTIRTVGPFKDGAPGAELSGAHATVNAGKLGLTLKLGHPKGREVALKLAAWADVVTESFTPGAMKRIGLDYDTLRAVNPGLIMVSSCLNGQTGPYRDLAGFGTMGQHLAGFGGLVGWPDRAPAGAPGAYTDYVAPKFTAAAILAALDHRRRTGEGQYIDVAQSEAAMHFLGPAILDYTVNDHVMGRNGNRSPNCSPHGVYRAAGDDRWVAIVASTDAQWHSLCRAMGKDLWLNDVRFVSLEARIANAEALDAEITSWTMTRDVEAIERTLQAAGAPVHRASTSTDLFADPQIAAREHFITVENPELGPVVIENSRMRFSATPAHVTSPGPTFGQHNQQVLSGILGLSEDDVIDLIAEGVLE